LNTDIAVGMQVGLRKPSGYSSLIMISSQRMRKHNEIFARAMRNKRAACLLHLHETCGKRQLKLVSWSFLSLASAAADETSNSIQYLVQSNTDATAPQKLIVGESGEIRRCPCNECTLCHDLVRRSAKKGPTTWVQCACTRVRHSESSNWLKYSELFI
jgi:hypothetical protein